MIKLKNLWKIALATMAMSAMLIACDESNDDDEVTPGTYTPGTGVYELKAKKSDIGSTFNSWGGFSVLLLKDTQVSTSVNPQEAGTFATPTAQITSAGSENLKFPKYETAKGNATVKSGENVINGAWAVLDDTDFTVYVDMAQLLIDDKAVEIKAFGDGNELMGDAWLKTGRNLDLTDYKPYVIALFDGTSDVVDNKYIGNCTWNCGIWEMKPSIAKRPTSFGTFLNEADVSAIDQRTTGQNGAKFKIEGAAYKDAEKEGEFKDGIATIEFSVAKDETNVWSKSYFSCWFKFYAGDDTTLAQTSKQYYANANIKLGEVAELTPDGDKGGNLNVSDLTATTAGTYIITVDATIDPPTIKVDRK